MIGLIGGYGIEDLVEDKEKGSAKCVFKGETSRKFVFYKGRIAAKDVMAIPRHGERHELPPHNVPYRSYIAALENAGAECIITVNSAGILKRRFPLESFFLPNDFVNFGGELTFFDIFRGAPGHVSMAEPYDKKIGRIVGGAARRLGLTIYGNVVYVNVRGPRLETRAEIRMYSKFGDIIGMTNAYEVMLANEKRIRICSVCLGANHAEGVGGKVTADKIGEGIGKMKKNLFKLVEAAIGDL